MHPPVGPAFLVYLETSGLAALMRQSQWLYPLVEIVHRTAGLAGTLGFPTVSAHARDLEELLDGVNVGRGARLRRALGAHTPSVSRPATALAPTSSRTPH